MRGSRQGVREGKGGYGRPSQQNSAVPPMEMLGSSCELRIPLVFSPEEDRLWCALLTVSCTD